MYLYFYVMIFYYLSKQFSLRYGCVVLVEADVASSKREEQVTEVW